MATIDLESHFLAATEAAAIAAAAWRGKGDRKAADGAAVEAMRAVFDEVPFDGRVAIGEGERDDAPMLWIGESLGSMQGIQMRLQSISQSTLLSAPITWRLTFQMQWQFSPLLHEELFFMPQIVT